MVLEGWGQLGVVIGDLETEEGLMVRDKLTGRMMDLILIDREGLYLQRE